MSNCDNCGYDDFWYPSWRKRKDDRGNNVLWWVCGSCRRAIQGLPAPEPEPRRRWDIFPPVAIVSAATVLVSVILAVGAHW